MVDTVSKSERSKIMSAVRSKNNRSTELRFIAFLKKERISGWRRHQPLMGKPDFVWKKAKLAVFIDGCFWHGCKNCYREPKSNVAFWQKKIAANKKRDFVVSRTLRKEGWAVIRLKECSFKNNRLLQRTLKQIHSIIND